MRYTAIDLFSGCGGLSEGLKQAGFSVELAVEIDPDAVNTYKLNHPETTVLQEDIRKLKIKDVKKILIGKRPHLLAGCPPCQGFSSMKRLNRKKAAPDERNDLIMEFLRFVKGLKPATIMMENVPGLKDYDLFKEMCDELKKYYTVNVEIVDIQSYGVPQRRKRLVLVGALKTLKLELKVAEGTGERKTVRDTIGGIESVQGTDDPVHGITANHTQKVKEIITKTPKNGGSRTDLPAEFILKCHKRENVGFKDVYGRLRWDDYSSTITSGCLNPSKGRFLHPEENRVISAREASLLQTFPPDYRFPTNISKTSIALLIGNALPPKFSYIQSKNIISHLEKYRD
ncbi:MAG: DNA cytosine methyltransferase [Candidatus Aminicenantes bacterium]|nr:DNA cytosine methyltransferase [Candidatus Aminicenantes bacterium]